MFLRSDGNVASCLLGRAIGVDAKSVFDRFPSSDLVDVTKVLQVVVVVVEVDAVLVLLFDLLGGFGLWLKQKLTQVHQKLLRSLTPRVGCCIGASTCSPASSSAIKGSR